MRSKILLIVLAGVWGWSASQASITDIPSWNYGGGLYCYAPVFNSTAQSVGLTGNQSSYGSIGLSITTDTTTDPTLTVNNSINNDSTFVWTEYVVNVAMNQSFSINSAGVVAPAGWTANITQPGGPVGGSYIGTIDYMGGTPVAIYPGTDSTLNYGYQVTFSGSTSYSLTESATPVPEPNLPGLLMVGGGLVGGRMAIKRRKQA